MNKHDIDTEDQRPLVISERKQVTAPFTVWISIISFACILVLGWSELRSQDETASKNAKALIEAQEKSDKRIDALEKTYAEIALMKNDIGWIRDTLERQDRISRKFQNEQKKDSYP